MSEQARRWKWLLVGAGLALPTVASAQSVDCQNAGIPPVDMLPTNIEMALKNEGVQTNQLEYVLFVKKNGKIDPYHLSNITTECWEDSKGLDRPGKGSNKPTDNALVVSHSSPAVLVDCRIIGGKRVCQESQ